MDALVSFRPTSAIDGLVEYLSELFPASPLRSSEAKRSMSFKYHDEKVGRPEKLSRAEQADLLYDLLNAFAELHNLPEAAAFVTDILTTSEVKNICKRLRIAKLLLEDRPYRDISQEMKVSFATIAKVAEWLKERGDGLRNILRRLPKRERPKHWSNQNGWDRYKRKNPTAFWPWLVMEDWEQSSIKNENKLLHGTLDKLRSKDAIRRQVGDLFKKSFRKKERGSK